MKKINFKTMLPKAGNMVFYLLPLIAVVFAIKYVMGLFKPPAPLDMQDEQNQNTITKNILKNTGAVAGSVLQDTIILYQAFNVSAVGWNTMQLPDAQQLTIKKTLEKYKDNFKGLAQLYAKYSNREHNERHEFLFGSVFNKQEKNLLQAVSEYLLDGAKPSPFSISFQWRLQAAIKQYA